MGLWIRKMEQKYGKFAIHNITLYLIICYAAGYVIQLINPMFLQYLNLNPYLICHGQIWRIVTWIIVPPDTLDIFTLIMLYFYYSIGTTLEQVWGTFTYNLYLFLGMILTVVGSFILFVVVLIQFGDNPSDVSTAMAIASNCMSTYYICMSIFFAFSMTFPDVQVLLMFILPIKVKWLGYVYGAILGLDVIQNLIAVLGGELGIYSFVPIANIIAIVFSVLNFIIFYVATRKNFRTPKQIKRQREYHRNAERRTKIAKHKCAICGRTSEEYPDLEFRFCSKCDGNYEYCSEHLFTHQHIKNS